MAQRGEGTVTARRRGPRPGTPRAPRMSRAAREQQLLDVAEQTFAERGYSETTMEQIAARAGITKPVIYDHFGSKERLLGAVVARNHEELLASSAASLSRLGAHADPEAYVRAGVTAFLQFFGRHRDSFRTYQQQAAVIAAAGGDIEKLRQDQASFIAERLGLLPDLASLPPHTRLGLAEILVGTNERVTAWWMRNPEVTLDEAVDLVMSVIWTGLASRFAEPGSAD